MVCAQLDSHSVQRKMGLWERESFFFYCLSHCHFPTSALCFLTCPLLHSLPPHFFFVSPSSLFFFFFWPTLLWMSPHCQILVYFLSFTSKSFSPLPQFSGSCLLHHTATSVEAEAGNLNVKPFDAPLWWAPAMDVIEESIHHKDRELTVNWVALRKASCVLLMKVWSLCSFFSQKGYLLKHMCLLNGNIDVFPVRGLGGCSFQELAINGLHEMPHST